MMEIDGKNVIKRHPHPLTIIYNARYVNNSLDRQPLNNQLKFMFYILLFLLKYKTCLHDLNILNTIFKLVKITGYHQNILNQLVLFTHSPSYLFLIENSIEN